MRALFDKVIGRSRVKLLETRVDKLEQLLDERIELMVYKLEEIQGVGSNV